MLRCTLSRADVEAEVNSWKKEEMTSYCSRNSLRRTTGTKAQLAELIVPAVLELDNLADRSFHLPIGTIILTGTEVGDPQRWTVLEVTDDSDRSLHPKEYIVWNPTYNDYVTTLNYSGDDYESEWITGPAEIRACFINKHRVYFKEGSHTKLEDEYVVVGHDKDLKDYKAFGEREEKKRQAEYDAEEKKRQARFAMEEKKRQAEEKAAEKKRNAHLQTQLRELAAVGVLPGAQLQVCWKLPNDDVKWFGAKVVEVVKDMMDSNGLQMYTLKYNQDYVASPVCPHDHGESYLVAVGVDKHHVYDEWGNRNRWRVKEQGSVRKDPVAPSPLAQKQAAPRVDRGKQADPVVWTGARVEVQWSMGRDKDRKWFAATVQSPEPGGGTTYAYILKYDACADLPFVETSRDVVLDKDWVYDCMQKAKLAWRLHQQPKPAHINPGAAGVAAGGEMAAFRNKLSDNVCAAVSMLPDMTAHQRQAVCEVLLRWGATTRADVVELLTDATGLTAVSRDTESAGVKRITWIKLKKACT